MSKTTRRLLVTFALLVELLSWATLLWDDTRGLLPFLLVHAVASALAAVGLGVGAGRSPWPLFVLALCNPFAGVPVMVALFAFYRPPAAAGAEALDTYATPRLPFRAGPHRSDLLSTDFDVEATALHAGTTEQRLAAVLAAGRLPTHVGVPILEKALADPEDEVRLLAHSLLETRERTLYSALAEDQAALQEAPPQVRPALHARLAHQHWELVYTGLARGDVAVHLLTEALTHAEEACREKEDGAMRLLMGRIHLRRADAQSAHDALQRALQAGLAPHLVHPYLAEAAWLLGRRDVLAFSARQLHHGPSPAPHIAEAWK